MALAMLARRYVPADVLMQWIELLRPGGWPGPTFTHRDLYPAEGRSVITEGALGVPGWDDLLWVDTDHLPSPLFMQRIAEYPPELPVIGGVYFGREYPYEVQAWDVGAVAGEGLLPIQAGRVAEMLTKPGLYPVGGVGTGWMLIRRWVLERMREVKGPGNVWEIETLSEQLRQRAAVPSLVIGEDVLFCLQVRQLLGLQVWLDTDPRIESQHLGDVRIDKRNWLASHLIQQPEAPARNRAERRAAQRRPVQRAR